MTQSPVLFLGAGASVKAGLPVSRAVTARMIEQHASRMNSQLGLALNYVIGSNPGLRQPDRSQAR